MKDIKIKDANLVTNVTGNEKIPVSNGSGKPVAVTINQILEKVPDNNLSNNYYTKTEIDNMIISTLNTEV